MERQELSRRFKIIAPNVYFQPPASKKIDYPCIIYKPEDIHTAHADNRLYAMKPKYTATVIDKDPDSEIPFKLIEFPLCGFDRYYVADNLHHWVFGIYF